MPNPQPPRMSSGSIQGNGANVKVSALKERGKCTALQRKPL